MENTENMDQLQTSENMMKEGLKGHRNCSESKLSTATNLSEKNPRQFLKIIGHCSFSLLL